MRRAVGRAMPPLGAVALAMLVACLLVFSVALPGTIFNQLIMVVFELLLHRGCSNDLLVSHLQLLRAWPESHAVRPRLWVRPTSPLNFRYPIPAVYYYILPPSVRTVFHMATHIAQVIPPAPSTPSSTRKLLAILTGGADNVHITCPAQPICHKAGACRHEPLDGVWGRGEQNNAQRSRHQLP